jgi:hypothetical protein
MDSHAPMTETPSGADLRYRNLYRLGGIAAIVQLASLLVMLVAQAALGPRLTSAEEFYIVQQASRWAAVLRGNLLLIFLIGPYLFTFPALYVALRRQSPVGAGLAALFTIMTVAMMFAAEETFALLRLGDLHAAALTDLERAQYVAAGEAVFASGMWDSSGAYMSGMLLQGAGVLMSIIMLRSRDFSRWTAYSGLLGNALDLTQHLLHPFVPAVSAATVPFMGIFYFVWFPMLGRDLLRLARRGNAPQAAP